MSKRRNLGDIVQLDDGDGEGPYSARVVASIGDTLHDGEVLSATLQATGEYVFHVSECNMADPATE